MTEYTYHFISLITGFFSPLPLFFFLHMELIKVERLVNARIAQLESCFQVLGH